LADEPNRLGKNGAEEIKNHVWFQDINWNQIKNMKPPFVPEL
jgi:protein-serine/threonine kinase